MLLEQIEKDLEEATRKQEPLILKTLRFILSEIRYEEIDKQRKLTDDEIISLLQKEIKKRNEAITLMKKGNRMELVDEENKKISVIKRYLPAQASSEELERVVNETISQMGKAPVGAVIGMVVGKLKGRVDGKRVVEIVKTKLRL